MNFKPVSNYILVRPVSVPDTTPSGLVLPESSLDKPNMGTVVAVGDGQLADSGIRIKVSVKVGDVILFPKYSGTDVTLNKEKYLIMRDTDLFGIVTNESRPD
jgi:chaperonin GroES